MRIAVLTGIVALALIPSVGFAQSTQPATTPAPAAAAPAATAPAAAPQNGGQQMSPEAKARFEKFRAACGADLQTHCGTVARGTDQSRGEMRQCIDANKAKFSPGCQAAVAERDANREARKQTAPAVAGEKPKS